MDSPLSVNFYTNSTWVFCFQLSFPQIQHGQSTFSYLLQNSSMDGSLSINVSKNWRDSVCFQLVSLHIQHGLPPFSWLLYDFKLGKLSAFNILFHKSNLDTLLSVNFSKNSTWATCFQLNYAQTQHGSLSFITFSTNPKLTASVLSNGIRCFSCP